MLRGKLKGKVMIGVMALSLMLTGCGGGANTTSTADTTEVAQARTEMNFVNFRDIRDLNPHLYAGEMYAQSIIYEPLVRVSHDGVEPCVAESWEISEDGKVYTFNIRQGITFTDGEVCDAHAVKANFEIGRAHV